MKNDGSVFLQRYEGHSYASVMFNGFTKHIGCFTLFVSFVSKLLVPLSNALKRLHAHFVPVFNSSCKHASVIKAP